MAVHHGRDRDRTLSTRLTGTQKTTRSALPPCVTSSGWMIILDHVMPGPMPKIPRNATSKLSGLSSSNPLKSSAPSNIPSARQNPPACNRSRVDVQHDLAQQSTPRHELRWYAYPASSTFPSLRRHGRRIPVRACHYAPRHHFHLYRMPSHAYI